MEVLVHNVEYQDFYLIWTSLLLLASVSQTHLVKLFNVAFRDISAILWWDFVVQTRYFDLLQDTHAFVNYHGALACQAYHNMSWTLEDVFIFHTFRVTSAQSSSTAWVEQSDFMIATPACFQLCHVGIYSCWESHRHKCMKILHQHFNDVIWRDTYVDIRST